MPPYRLYYTDNAAHILSAEIVDAKSDRDAMSIAREKLNGASGELWLEGKMVCRITSKTN